MVEWEYEDLRLVELVEELMLRQQVIAGLVQRLEERSIMLLLLLVDSATPMTSPYLHE